MEENILQLQNITKTFGSLIAVDKVDFALRKSEIHAVLGENGAGKSTLMNLIYGLYQPSNGSIYISGKHKVFRSPRDAIANGIGMVHQHFMLIENLSVAENIALSLKTQPPNTSNPLSAIIQKYRFKKAEAVRTTEALSQQFGLAVDANAIIRTLSVGLKQRVEILKALAMDARILILDEPTAVLSPHEVEDFFTILHNLKTDNRSIILISHKMKEVLHISDRITVLRRGKKVYLGKTGELTARELAKEMLGEEITELVREEHHTTADVVLNISRLTVRGTRNELAVTDVSLQTKRGEIVGIAGVDGNGQRELAETIMGLRKKTRGTIEILGTEPQGTKAVRLLGVGYIPEDRQTTGIIGSFSIAENLLLSVSHLNEHSRWRVLSQKRKRETTARLISDYDVRPPTANLAADALSGGNQQKVVLAREMSHGAGTGPELLIAVNPTRGLDVSAMNYVHRNLLAQRDANKSVLLISTELDEVLQLSDRLYVMSSGKLHEATEQRDDIAALGLLMTGETKPDD